VNPWAGLRKRREVGRLSRQLTAQASSDLRSSKGAPHDRRGLVGAIAVKDSKRRSAPSGARCELDRACLWALPLAICLVPFSAFSAGAYHGRRCPDCSARSRIEWGLSSLAIVARMSAGSRTNCERCSLGVWRPPGSAAVKLIVVRVIATAKSYRRASQSVGRERRC
jgi:hypothetical protein